jgi:hypothetical protein
LLVNGKQIDSVTELNHLDRLVFGASQYYAFIDPSKSNGRDSVFTFEMAQDEIAEKRGLITKDNRQNMTQGLKILKISCNYSEEKKILSYLYK